MTDPADIKDWHAHVYFDGDSIGRARARYTRIEAAFPGAVMGRIHEKPVGPHPAWSYQVAFGPELLDGILPWIVLNRDGLDVFVHPTPGDDLTDNRDLAAFLGRSDPFNRSIFA